MKWLLREVISKARDLRFPFGRQDFWTWRILNYFDLINRLVSDEKTKTKKNWSETRCKWLDFLQWQTGDRIRSRALRIEFKLGPATWPKENSESAVRAYSWATLVTEKKILGKSVQSDWKSDSLSLTWAPTVQAGPASEKSDVTIAFYHKKEPNYGDRAMGWVKTRWLMLIGWSVSWWLVAS